MSDISFFIGVRDTLDEILGRIGQMEQALQELRAEVERNNTVVASASALISGLADQLEQFADDPAQVRALVEQLRSQTDALSFAVASNTPSEEPV